MTETRRAVPKGAALFISLFLHADPPCTQAPPRLSSFRAARMTRRPLLLTSHLLPLPHLYTAKDLPARSSARQTTATGTPLSAPPLPCAHRCGSSQRDRHGEEVATARAASRKVVQGDQACARLLHERHDQTCIRRSKGPSAFRGLKKPAVFRRSACVHCRGNLRPLIQFRSGQRVRTKTWVWM